LRELPWLQDIGGGKLAPKSRHVLKLCLSFHTTLFDAMCVNRMQREKIGLEMGMDFMLKHNNRLLKNNLMMKTKEVFRYYSTLTF